MSMQMLPYNTWEGRSSIMPVTEKRLKKLATMPILVLRDPATDFSPQWLAGYISPIYTPYL